MHSIRLILLLSLSVACSEQKSSPKSQSAGSAEAPPPAPPAPPPVDAQTATTDGSEEVARMVVRDVGSKALGSQTIEPSCVTVAVFPSGPWTVAAARLNGCGDKTARSILWLYKRSGNGKWNEDYVGQPPKCWKGVPADLVEAVTTVTRIPSC